MKIDHTNRRRNFVLKMRPSHTGIHRVCSKLRPDVTSGFGAARDAKHEQGSTHVVYRAMQQWSAYTCILISLLVYALKDSTSTRIEKHQTAKFHVSVKYSRIYACLQVSLPVFMTLRWQLRLSSSTHQASQTRINSYPLGHHVYARRHTLRIWTRSTCMYIHQADRSRLQHEGNQPRPTTTSALPAPATAKNPASPQHASIPLLEGLAGVNYATRRCNSRPCKTS